MWSIQNILLLIAGLVNLLMSIFIISRGWKNKVNLYFSLLTFFNFLWAGGLFFVNDYFDIETIRFFSSFVYPISLVIMYLLMHFVIHFPYKDNTLSKYMSFTLKAIILIVGIFCLFFYNNFSYDINISGSLVIYFYKPVFFLHSISVFVLAIYSIYILIRKYNMADKIFKNQLKFILLAVIVGSFGGLLFNVVLVSFGIFNYIFLGPIFTLFINFTAFSLIYYCK